MQNGARPARRRTSERHKSATGRFMSNASERSAYKSKRTIGVPQELLRLFPQPQAKVFELFAAANSQHDAFVGVAISNRLFEGAKVFYLAPVECDHNVARLKTIVLRGRFRRHG